MKKAVLLIGIVWINFYTQAQEQVFESDKFFSKSHPKKNESIALSNQENKDVMLISFEKEVARAFLLDSMYQQKTEITINTFPRKYKKFLAYSVYDVSLESVEFPSIPGSKILIKAQSQFRGTRAEGNPSDQKGAFTKIDVNYPNLIETTSKKVKLYLNDNIVTFTFDRNPEKTDVTAINLDTFEESHKSFTKVPIPMDKKKFSNHNSYLFDNKLFQVATRFDELYFKIVDTETNEILKTHYIKKEDTISFKNSPIIFEKTGKNKILIAPIKIDKKKSIEKTKKFLSKLTTMRLGVAAHKAEGKYVVTIGGTTDYDPNAVLRAAFFTVRGMASVGAGTPFVAGYEPFNAQDPFYTNFNTVHYNYYNHSFVKSTNARKTAFIDCLFDENLNHVQGEHEIPVSEFDKLSDFEETLKKPEAVHIFRHNNKLHYGFYEKDNGSYKIYNFTH